jgi:hypothetical protein
VAVVEKFSYALKSMSGSTTLLPLSALPNVSTPELPMESTFVPVDKLFVGDFEPFLQETGSKIKANTNTLR